MNLLLIALLTAAPAPAAARPVAPPHPAASAPAAREAPAAKVEPELVALAEALEEGIGEGETGALDKALDVDALVARVTQGVQAPKRFEEQFTAGMRKGVSRSLGKQLVDAMGAEGASFELLRVRRETGAVRALYRLASDDGLAYFDFELARDAQGRARVVDVFLFAAGEQMSATMRRMYLMAAAEADQGLLERLAGQERAFLSSAPRMRELQELVGAGKNAEALAVFAKLPEAMRREKLVQLLRIRAASALDSEQHRAALEDFEAMHPGDPALDLMAIDGHYLRKDYAALKRTLARLDRRVDDPYLDFFLGSLLFEKGDRKEASEAWWSAIKRDRTFTEPYFALINLSLEAREHKETARLLTLLERDTGTELNDPAEVADYAEFAKSAEYRAWKKARRAAATARTEP